MRIEVSVTLQRESFSLAAEFSVPASGVTALFGPSGAGKTTLLRTIAGLEHTSSGRIAVGEHVWQDARRFVPVHQRSVGFVFQEPSLFDHLDVRGNLAYALERARDPRASMSFDRVVELLRLERLLERSCTDLSGGEKQRVALGRALLGSPRLLLMDEPLSGLDVGHKRELFPFLERLQSDFDLPVIYVSHAPDEVARLADHLVLMKDGATIAAGPITELLTDPRLPLARDEESAAVVRATVGEYDSEFGLTLLQFPGGELAVPGNAGAPGERRRVRIMARDVSLTLERQHDTSILNIVPATVIDITEAGEALDIVRLDAAGTTLLARVTRKSTRALGLAAGHTVFAQIKTIALLNG